MRLLYITRKWPPSIGGMETYSVELVAALKALPNTSVDVEFLPARNTEQGPTLLALFFFFCKMAFLLVRKARNYDVVHFGDFVLTPLSIFAKLGNFKIRLAVSLHGLDIFYGQRKGILPYFYSLLTSLNAYLVSFFRISVISNSKATDKAARALKIQTTIIPLGAKERPLPYSDTKNGEYIVFTGRIMSRKGPAWFAENVMPYLPDEIRLVVVGPESEKAEVAILRSNPRVDIIGPRIGEELDYIRYNSLCVVMPNRRSMVRGDIEGFGLIAPEASMVGGIVLASNVEGISSAIDNGTTGFLLDPEFPKIWANKILEIRSWSTEERRSFIERSIAKTKAYYNWDRVARETKMAYGS